jgi:hypothetical protein
MWSLTKAALVAVVLLGCYAPMEPRCTPVPDSLIVKSDTAAVVHIWVCQ